MSVRDLDPIPVGIGRYHLRAPHLDDVGAIHAGIEKLEVTRMLASIPYPCPRQTVAGWVEISTARRAGGTGLQFVIAGPETVGVVGFAEFGRETELGYWLLPSAQGNGLMTAAARAALLCAFENGAETIRSGAFTDNPASLRVQRKLGFDIVGESSIYSFSRKQRVAHVDTRLGRRTFMENGLNR